VVLKRALLLLALFGCKQSLFQQGDDDSTVDSGGIDPDGMVQTTCGAMCLGDAGGELGDPKWQYLEDNRNRTWTAMTGSGTYVGTNAANTITSCAQKPSAPACGALPNALLMSSAGATAGADSAIAFSSSTKQVIKLSLRVHSVSKATQVRLYRNSREDALFTALAPAGETLETAIQLDALTGDRFVFALGADGAQDVGVQLFINGTGMEFPQQCLTAIQFNGDASNACGMKMTYWDDSGTTSMELTPPIGSAPFPELGMAGLVTFDHYYEGGAAIDRMGDHTTQFWLKQDMVSFADAIVFSDIDLELPGGLEIYLTTAGVFGAGTCKDTVNYTYAYVNTTAARRICASTVSIAASTSSRRAACRPCAGRISAERRIGRMSNFRAASTTSESIKVRYPANDR
jgi:hypothetical protein